MRNFKLCYVLGLDKASYHRVLISPVLISKITNICKTGSVTEIIYLPFSPTVFTAKLFKFVRLNKPQFIKLQSDAFLKECGHSVLCLPPYPGLIPM